MIIPTAPGPNVFSANVGGTGLRFLLQRTGHPNVFRGYPTAQFNSLGDGIACFLQDEGSPKISVACFGVAAPVLQGPSGQYGEGMNLPWENKRVEAALLSQQLSCPVYLLNDAVAESWGIPALVLQDLAVLNAGGITLAEGGNQCLMTVGTGCGQCGMPWIADLGRHDPFGTEGSHDDWGPYASSSSASQKSRKRVALHRRLHGFLADKYGHVSTERVACGQGLVDIFDCLVQVHKPRLPRWLTERLDQQDPASVVAEAALATESLRQNTVCKRALDEFVWCLGAAAGNLALGTGAWHGVFVGGGIPPKILPGLLVQDSDPDAPTFMNGFVYKGRHTELMKSVPVHVVLNSNLGVLGAARYARLQLEKGVKTRIF